MYNSIFIPTSVYDGFLDDPDGMRELALSQEYSYDEEGRWPGKRSKPLHEIAPHLYYPFMNKQLYTFYSRETKFQYRAISQFQLIDENYNYGWIHTDPDIITTILYLSPNNTCGTSLYKKTDYVKDFKHLSDKKNAYLSHTDNIEGLKKNNEMFEETVNIKGEYNRLLMFDSRLYHGAHKYFGSDIESTRLTLVTFIKSLSSEEGTPITRSKSIPSDFIL